VAAPWLTAISMPHLLRAVGKVGGDPAALATRFALEPAPRFEDRIPIATVITAWEAAMAATGRRDLPAQAGIYTEPDEHSLVAFAIANQPRIGDGMNLLERYYPTVSNAYRWHHVVDDAGVHLCAAPPGPVHRAGWQAYLEFELTDMIAGAKRLTGGAAVPTAVRFLHPAPPAAYIAELARIYGVAPVFAADACEAVFPAAVLDLPVPTARPHLAVLIEERLTAMLDAIERGHDVSARARLAVSGLLRDGACDVAGLAKALHMSRRSLERALAEEGTSASALIEDERTQLALAWLPELSVDEVAARLGYSDTRAFARAFKRWTGQAPGQVRKRT
jgi:AraC-like DNA-binding protein